MKKLPWTSAALQQTKGWGRVGGEKCFHHPYEEGCSFLELGRDAPSRLPRAVSLSDNAQTLQRSQREEQRDQKKKDLAPLNRGAHQLSLPRRATSSSRHPLPPPLPVTLRKEEHNCSCPSKWEDTQLNSFFTPPTESQTLLVSLPTPPPHSSFRAKARAGRISPPPPCLPFRKQRCPYPSPNRSG